MEADLSEPGPVTRWTALRPAEFGLEADDIAGWAAFLPTVRVGGGLPITFRLDGDHVLVEMIAPFILPMPEPLTDPNKVSVGIAEGFPVPISSRYRLPRYVAAHAADYLHHIAREVYQHELDEQFRVGNARPFAPEHLR